MFLDQLDHWDSPDQLDSLEVRVKQDSLESREPLALVNQELLDLLDQEGFQDHQDSLVLRVQLDFKVHQVFRGHLELLETPDRLAHLDYRDNQDHLAFKDL